MIANNLGDLGICEARVLCYDRGLVVLTVENKSYKDISSVNAEILTTKK